MLLFSTGLQSHPQDNPVRQLVFCMEYYVINDTGSNVISHFKKKTLREEKSGEDLSLPMFLEHISLSSEASLWDITEKNCLAEWLINYDTEIIIH